MILTPTEYSQQYRLNNRKVSARTVIRWAVKGLLPSGHTLHKLKGKTGCHLIEIQEVAKT